MDMENKTRKVTCRMLECYVIFRFHRARW